MALTLTDPEVAEAEVETPTRPPRSRQEWATLHPRPSSFVCAACGLSDAISIAPVSVRGNDVSSFHWCCANCGHPVGAAVPGRAFVPLAPKTSPTEATLRTELADALAQAKAARDARDRLAKAALQALEAVTTTTEAKTRAEAALAGAQQAQIEAAQRAAVEGKPPPSASTAAARGHLLEAEDRLAACVAAREAIDRDLAAARSTAASLEDRTHRLALDLLALCGPAILQRAIDLHAAYVDAVHQLAWLQRNRALRADRAAAEMVEKMPAPTSTPEGVARLAACLQALVGGDATHPLPE